MPRSIEHSHNGVAHPQYLASVSDACFDLSYTNNRDHSNTGCLVTSREQFNDSHAVFTCQLGLSDESISLCSGLDSRGVSSQLEIKFTGLNVPADASLQCFVVCECSSEIRIGNGLSVALAS